MKVLGFATTLVPLVLSGAKTTTWRLYDTRDLKPGQLVLFEETVTRKPFAFALIKRVRTKRFADVIDRDFEGHEKYEDTQTMYETFRSYYGNLAAPQAPLRIVQFELVKTLS